MPVPTTKSESENKSKKKKEIPSDTDPAPIVFIGLHNRIRSILDPEGEILTDENIQHQIRLTGGRAERTIMRCFIVAELIAEKAGKISHRNNLRRMHWMFENGALNI